MSDKEMEIVRRFGASTYAVYVYFKRSIMARRIDMEVDLNLSNNSLTKAIANLKSANVISRTRIKNRLIETEIKNETEWRIQ
jgi:hypothetical protein